MKVLIVGGTWTVDNPVNHEIERRSSMVDVANIATKNYCEHNYGCDYEVDMYNGGCYYSLESI